MTEKEMATKDLQEAYRHFDNLDDAGLLGTALRAESYQRWDNLVEASRHWADLSGADLTEADLGAPEPENEEEEIDLAMVIEFLNMKL